MKKHQKQFICIVLVLYILTCCCSAFALNEEPESVEFSHIDEVGAGISINWLGKATCFSDVELTYSTDTCHLYMDLQRLVDGVWTTVTSWNATGSIYVAITDDYYVTSGYYYRVYTQVYVYNSSGTFVEYAGVESSSEYY